MTEGKEIVINGTAYVRADSVSDKTPAKELDGLKYCIVRTYSAGVFAGYLASREGKEGMVLNARRIWKWSGAASLSQLAMEGTKNPNDCKFPCEVDTITLTEIIEIIQCTEKARKSIADVKVWQM